MSIHGHVGRIIEVGSMSWYCRGGVPHHCDEDDRVDITMHELRLLFPSGASKIIMMHPNQKQTVHCTRQRKTSIGLADGAGGGRASVRKTASGGRRRPEPAAGAGGGRAGGRGTASGGRRRPEPAAGAGGGWAGGRPRPGCRPGPRSGVPSLSLHLNISLRIIIYLDQRRLAYQYFN